ncbi:MAG TPA: response regulator [Methylomirabilota bacterium]|jgi:PAS domain S-box-containing protein|nr:response regulator [Methylomirabilota bacterium]
MRAAEAARILVVEDNSDTSALLRDLLEAEGYEVDSVMTGEAALDALEIAPDVDLVVLDLMLPGMSGYEVIERLRGGGALSDVPVLVLSALSSVSARVRGLRDGADDYMTKPFLPEELVARTRTLVTRRLLERRTEEMQALAQIAQAALTAPSADVLLQRMVEIAVEVFHADAAAILLADDGGRVLHARASIGFAHGPGRVPLGTGVAATAMATQSPVLIPDGAAQDPRVTDPAVRREGFRSLMVAPLVLGGPMGVLEVARRSRRLDPRADRLLRIVADRVAVAIEQSRLESEARELADVVRRIGEGVVVADADDRVVFANRAFLEMVGVTSDGLHGRPWTEFLSSAQDVTALIQQMRAPSYQGELLLITKAGDPLPVLVTLSSVAREGESLQRIGVFRDISREHELRFRVIREQKFRTLGSLAAGVAHNINNRLTPVLGWTEMLLERLAADEAIESEELKHALNVINQGASDSVETVRRLQEYSRPARVKGPEGVQLSDVVEQLLALTRPQWDNEAARRGIRYEIDFKSEPAPAVLAVASEIREALLNILENALAAMPQGGRLTLHVRGEDDRAVVSIADTGRGMSPEVQRLAFEPFFTTRASEGGTGLGLALAQEIVQRYRGTITITSAVGVGTTFAMSFPSVTAEATRTTAFLPVIEPLRILAVEDEPEVLDVIRAMLTAAGHTVFTAASGREALEIFDRETTDLLVTDLGMPGMTGLALAGEIRRRRLLPVVLLTGWADELDTQPPDVDVVLAKPFTRERLLDGIARAVPDRVRPL